MQETEAVEHQSGQTLRPKGIAGSTLKLIAMTSMLLDHTGAVLVERVLFRRGMMEAVDPESFQAFLAANAGLYCADQMLRFVGRMAFPIFCFLLVQGFLHTHNLKKYLGRLFLFALISEVPFDFALAGKPCDWSLQNVYFTLFLGVFTLAGIRMAEEKAQWHVAWRVALGLLCTVLGAGAAALLDTDYGFLGVLAIVTLYLLRDRKTLSAGASCTVLCCVAVIEVFSFASLLPLSRYNGKKGSNQKWLFYLFYPAHLLLLYLLSRALGLGAVSMG
ncbi:MAG: TraX family protein [Oscillospiraceae bacterium]